MVRTNIVQNSEEGGVNNCFDESIVNDFITRKMHGSF